MPRLYQKSVGCATYFGFHFVFSSATIGCIGLTMGFVGIFLAKIFLKALCPMGNFFSPRADFYPNCQATGIQIQAGETNRNYAFLLLLSEKIS